MDKKELYKMSEKLYKILGPIDKCQECGSNNTYIKNYDMMWYDGKLHCRDCGTFIRDWDAD